LFAISLLLNVLSGEHNTFEGESFVVGDGAGVFGIAIVDLKGALAIVTVDVHEARNKDGL
jgi:hypothetical protein